MDTIIPQKHCPMCNQLLPTTHFSSNKNTSDGLEPRCKECRKQYRPRKTPIPEPIAPGYKRCAQCQQEKPATPEYFIRNKNLPKGLNSYCKECWAMRYRKYPPKAPAPNGYKRCTCCNELKPATNEHFNLNIATGFCRPCYSQRGKQDYRTHREAILIKHKQYRETNSQRIHQLQKHWRLTHREHIHLYYINHREQAKAANQKRRAHKRNNGGTYTAQNIRLQYERQKGKCYYCHKKVNKQYHVDHIVPLSRGGSNDPYNLVIACPHCNLSKGKRLLHEWIKGGHLL